MTGPHSGPTARVAASLFGLILLVVPAVGPVAAAGPQAGPTGSAQPSPRFTPVTAEAGVRFEHTYGGARKAYITEMGGSGAGWVDYDVDGWPDLFLVNGVPLPGDGPGATPGHRLFRSEAGSFADVTGAAGVGDRVWGNGVASADVDADGFDDLYVTAIGPNRLFRNNGDGTFSAWPAGVEDPGWGTSAAFTDWDGDGVLDLYVVNYIDFDPADTATLGDGVCSYRGIEVFCGPEGLEGARDVFYRGRRQGDFEPWPGVEVDAEGTYGFALVATDCDGDHRPDLYVASDSTINLLYRHGDDGSLEDWSLFSGAGYSGSGREQAGMGVTAADFDGDADMDLFVTNFENDHNTLYRNEGGCMFDDVSEAAGLSASSLPFMGWAPLFLDADGDGDQDLFVANGQIYPQLEEAGLAAYAQRNLLYVNELAESGRGGFLERGESAGPGLQLVRPSRGAAKADYDNDGDADLVVTNIDDSPDLLRNDTPGVSPVLRLTLVSRSGNRGAHGARVEVTSADRRQVHELRRSDGYVGSNDPRLLVHLPGGTAEVVEVTWPDGDRTELREVEPGWIVVDQERGVIARRPR